MRCKNCGSENDDNLYICQNCGSPLYDENEPEAAETDSTQVFEAVGGAGAAEQTARSDERAQKKAEADKKKKQTTIIIIVLVAVLLAIIIGTVIAVAHAKKGNEQTTLSTVTSTTIESTTEAATTTTTETTTESTTESTTKETTTKAQKYSVSLTCNNGGEVEGDGKYAKGEEVTVIARPDDGYDFDGWYKGSKKVSSKTDYTFTVMKDTNLTAYFVLVDDGGSGGADTIDGQDD